MKRGTALALKILGAVTVVPILLLVLYFAAWCVIYRIPPSPSKLVDKTQGRPGPAHYISFCSSLADNVFGGYPGHGYVIWSDEYPIKDFEKTESAGFVPKFFKDQIPSMVTVVPGLMVHDAWRGNLEKFTCLAVKVDGAAFERTKQIRDSWAEDRFQVGRRDCATFSNQIAASIGLRTPDPTYVYPQDYVRHLKEMN